MARRDLNRLRVLKDVRTPRAAAEFARVVAILGEDVVAEHQWGISQTPMYY